MKVIDLLNKIANGEEVPKKIKFKSTIYELDETETTYYDAKDVTFMQHYNFKILSDEVEIIEEENKIPEKLPYYSMEKIQKAKNKDEWREERITLLEKRVEDLHIKMNDLLDYLKEKENK